jgi:ankyrin repeat protein
VTNPDELTAALVEAVWRDDAVTAKALLDAGADPNRVLKDNWTPIHCAVENERLDMIRLLMRNGADVNLRSRNGITPRSMP